MEDIKERDEAPELEAQATPPTDQARTEAPAYGIPRAKIVGEPGIGKHGHLIAGGTILTYS